MTTWLTDAWFEQARELASARPEHIGLSARIQLVVTGGVDGDVRSYWVLEDGHVARGGIGDIDDPDVTLTTEYADAVGVVKGDLDPNVAFMQGRMKVSGSMGVMIRLLRETTTPEYQAWRRQIADVTEF